MANEDQVQRLKDDVRLWNINRKATGEAVDLSGAFFVGVDLKDANLTGITSKKSSDLTWVIFRKCNFDGAGFLDVKASNIRFENCVLKNSHLRDAVFEEAHITSTDFETCRLSNADYRGAYFSRCHFKSCDLSFSDFRSATFRECDLGGCDFQRVRISRKSSFVRVKFGPDHPVLEDGSDTIIFSKFDQVVNWKTLRWIGNLPFFGISYFALGACTLGSSLLHLFNKYLYMPVASREGFPLTHNYIPIPHSMRDTIVASVLIAFGSTLFRVMCPQVVQGFSETQWTAQLNKARLIYISQYLPCSGEKFNLHGIAQCACGVSMLLGGAIAIRLLFERLMSLWIYINLYQ